MAQHERIGARDAVFLHMGDEAAPMQFAVVLVFEGPGLLADEDHLDIERLRAHVQARLEAEPRLRQRLVWPGAFAEPVWVDDPHFDIASHVRHVAAPRPGDAASLKALSGAIHEQRLDLSRPLWEIWAVEGLEDGRFALVCKAHHSLLDGMAGITTMAGVLLGAEPIGIGPPPKPWRPEPAPGRVQLLASDLVQRGVSAPAVLLSGLRTAAETIGRGPLQFADNLRDALGSVLAGASDTPLNGLVGPSRRVDWFTVELAEIRKIREAFGGTLNDVVLASVAGGAGDYLEAKGLLTEELDFRALVPIDGGEGESRALENHVSAFATPLPIAERDPKRRLAETRRLVRHQRDTDQDHTFEVANWIAAQTHSAVAGAIIQATMNGRFHNLMVTNLPGPPIPLYVLEAPMVGAFPAAQLYPRQGLSLAVMSYHEELAWGFAADPELVPDLADFLGHVRAAFRDLVAAAEAA